jgi:GntR family transcriptional repressor for pyruvate dehydrogenase complex
MTLQKVVVTSAALEAANVLREEILRDVKDDEWLLGSEDAVMQALEVSRPTLRQALRLLEQEQLIAVRRGVGGGLFARPPTEEGVTHTASVLLRAAGTSYGDLIQTLGVVSVHSARMAAQNPDAKKRASLLTYYQDQIGDIDPTTMPGPEFVPIAGHFFIELAEIATSPTVRLFTSVLIDLARPSAGRALYTPERIRETIDRHSKIAAAVADGKPDLAAKRMQAHEDIVLHWTDSSLKLESMYPGRHMVSRRRPTS